MPRVPRRTSKTTPPHPPRVPLCEKSEIVRRQEGVQSELGASVAWSMTLAEAAAEPRKLVRRTCSLGEDLKHGPVSSTASVLVCSWRQCILNKALRRLPRYQPPLSIARQACSTPKEGNFDDVLQRSGCCALISSLGVRSTLGLACVSSMPVLLEMLSWYGYQRNVDSSTDSSSRREQGSVGAG